MTKAIDIRQLAHLGAPIFIAPNSKSPPKYRPDLPSKRYKWKDDNRNAVAEPIQNIEAHLAEGGNWAISPKPGTVVVDIDSHKDPNPRKSKAAKNLAKRLISAGALHTGSNRPDFPYDGHYWLRCADIDSLPAKFATGELDQLLGDIKKPNDYVVMPLSNVNGREYLHFVGEINQLGKLPPGLILRYTAAANATNDGWAQQTVAAGGMSAFEYHAASTSVLLKKLDGLKKGQGRQAYIDLAISKALGEGNFHEYRERIAEQQLTADDIGSIKQALARVDSIAERKRRDFGLADVKPEKQLPKGTFYDVVRLIAKKQAVNESWIIANLITQISGQFGGQVRIPPVGGGDYMPMGLYTVGIGAPGAGKSSLMNIVRQIVENEETSFRILEGKLTKIPHYIGPETVQGMYDAFKSAASAKGEFVPVSRQFGGRIGWVPEWRKLRAALANDRSQNNPDQFLCEMYYGNAPAHTTSAVGGNWRPELRGMNLAVIAAGHEHHLEEFARLEAGDPHRWLMVRARRTAFDGEDIPLPSLPIDIEVRKLWTAREGVEVQIGKKVRNEIKAWRRSLMRDDFTYKKPEHEHIVSMRMKVAANIAAISGDEPKIKMNHWNESEPLITERNKVLKNLRKGKKKRGRLAAQHRGRERQIEQRAVNSRERVEENLRRFTRELIDNGEKVNKTNTRGRLAYNHRKQIDSSEAWEIVQDELANYKPEGAKSNEQ